MDMEMELLKRGLHYLIELLIDWCNWSWIGPVTIYFVLLGGVGVFVYLAMRIMDYYIPNGDGDLEDESLPFDLTEPYEVLYDYVHCPVAFEVKESSTQTPDTLQFQLTLEPEDFNNHGTETEEDSIIQGQFKCKIFWGIHVKSLTKLIYSDLRNFYQEIEGSPEDLDSLGISHLVQLNTHIGERIGMRMNLEVKLPENVKWEHMMNTYRYPVCFLIYRVLNTNTFSQLPRSTNRQRRSMSCFFVILHLKNQLIDIPTTVLGRFIKLSDNTTYPVKELYLSDVNNEDSDEEQEAETSPGPNEAPDNTAPPHRTNNPLFPGVTCTVCRTLAATITILPCGHLCVCGICLTKLTDPSCPICRGWIHSFFQAY